ncbi:MAG: hypothetical protein K8T91_21375 [Planctomycetes bacterium]|nr:hypothetical protein [Planctomycetota bacterium]
MHRFRLSPEAVHFLEECLSGRDCVTDDGTFAKPASQLALQRQSRFERDQQASLTIDIGDGEITISGSGPPQRCDRYVDWSLRVLANMQDVCVCCQPQFSIPRQAFAYMAIGSFEGLTEVRS